MKNFAQTYFFIVKTQVSYFFVFQNPNFKHLKIFEIFS